MNPKVLETVASVLEVGASVVAGASGGDVAAGAKIADGLLLIIQKGISAYEAQTGQPIDPSLLRPFVPVE